MKAARIVVFTVAFAAAGVAALSPKPLALQPTQFEFIDMPAVKGGIATGQTQDVDITHSDAGTDTVPK
jgi:hypothetical protein